MPPYSIELQVFILLYFALVVKRHNVYKLQYDFIYFSHQYVQIHLYTNTVFIHNK